MIILDVETTGTNPLMHSLVSIGAVDFMQPQIQFYEECKIWDGSHIEPGALQVNGYSIDEIHDEKKQSETDLVNHFLQWIHNRDDMVIAGMNVSFDINFVEAAAQRAGESAELSHRSIDLHTITFTHMLSRGENPPLKHKKTALDSDAVMKYVGIPVEPKPHIALNGALWEAEAFSRIVYKKPLLDQFIQYPIPW